MRNKKVVEISEFNNFSKETTNKIVTKKFYNYFPTKTLNNSKGIEVALFQKNVTNKTEKELKISDTTMTKVESLSYFKQYQSKEKFTTHRLVVYGDDKKVYFNQLIDDTWDLFWLYNLTFETEPIVLTYKRDDIDTAILAGDNKMVVWVTGFSPYTIENVPVITSMCMNEGVLFCTVSDPAFKIWYATDLDLENVGNISNYSGYIMLEDNLGYARKVVVFNEEVFVFRDYGISKISYIRNNATVSQVYQSNTLIYTNTVSVCGNTILFMTKDGLYSFNGVKVTKAKVELINALSVDNAGSFASSLGEKYYLSLNIDFADDNKILCEGECINNSLLIVDTCDFSYEIIRGVDIKSMLPLKTEVFEKMLFTFNSGPINKIGQMSSFSKIMEENLPKFWASEQLLDDINTKLFTKLSVDADMDVKFTLLCDGKRFEFTTYKEGVNEFMFKVCCKKINLEISSSMESANVKKVALDYYEY